MALHSVHPTADSDEYAEESGRPSRAGPKIEDPVTLSWVQERQHVGDRARLGVRLPIADLQRHIAGGEASFLCKNNSRGTWAKASVIEGCGRSGAMTSSWLIRHKWPEHARSPTIDSPYPGVNRKPHGFGQTPHGQNARKEVGR